VGDFHLVMLSQQEFLKTYANVISHLSPVYHFINERWNEAVKSGNNEIAQKWEAAHDTLITLDKTICELLRPTEIINH